MQLTVEKRDTKTKAKALREAAMVPGVVYGRSQASTPIAVNRKDFEKVFRAAGESSVITLVGLDGDKEALIHDVSVHAVSGAPLHVDFYAIEKGQTVTVSVPLEFEGISPAVKDHGATLLKVMHEIEMEVLPKDLPQMVRVDVSILKAINDKITVSDLALPASAIITAGGDEVVAMAAAAEEEVESAPIDISQIETSVERGKKEVEEGATEAE